MQAKAEGWGFVADAEAYAKAAVDGSVPVELFDQAMEEAGKQLQDSESQASKLKAEIEDLGEIGVADAEELAAPVDGVEAALKAQGKIKN